MLGPHPLCVETPKNIVQKDTLHGTVPISIYIYTQVYIYRYAHIYIDRYKIDVYRDV